MSLAPYSVLCANLQNSQKKNEADYVKKSEAYYYAFLARTLSIIASIRSWVPGLHTTCKGWTCMNCRDHLQMSQTLCCMLTWNRIAVFVWRFRDQSAFHAIVKKKKVKNHTMLIKFFEKLFTTAKLVNIKYNHSIPSIESLIKICEALDITPDYFLLGIVGHTNDSLLSRINQRIKLCDEKKLELVDHFITWVVDEKL